jgi:hypothetical protein
LDVRYGKPAEGDREPPEGPIGDLFKLTATRLAELSRNPTPGHVASDLTTVLGALEQIVEQDLARGPLFCEWGSGLGAVTVLACLLHFEAFGIEIDASLVEASRQLAADMDVDATFANGSFLLPGDEELVAGSKFIVTDAGSAAYRELGLTPQGCDVVFAYPWPGDEEALDAVFLRHSTPGALLLTYHDATRLLVQRHVEGEDELQPLGWM